MAMLTRVRAAMDRAHWWEAVLSGNKTIWRSNARQKNDGDYRRRGVTPDLSGTVAYDAGEDPRPS